MIYTDFNTHNLQIGLKKALQKHCMVFYIDQDEISLNYKEEQ